MRLTRRILNGVTIIDVAGHMTGLDSPGQLKEQVVGALAAGEKRMVLNFSQLSFVDSSFIGELVTCVLAVTRAGGTLKLACVVRRVQELLYITRLASVIESFESEQAAVASFSRPAN